VGDSKEEGGDNATSKDKNKYQQSIASLDLIAENANFVSIK
jgi:hypothetical protein